MDLSSDLRAALRQEVGRLRSRDRRRVFDVSVCVGHLGGERAAVAVPAQEEPLLDAGLRTDLVAALLERADPSWRSAWLLRPGMPDHHDRDLAWFSAARMAFGALDRRLEGFYAVTRSGWLDVVTGERKTWKRLRL